MLPSPSNSLGANNTQYGHSSISILRNGMSIFTLVVGISLTNRTYYLTDLPGAPGEGTLTPFRIR